MFGNTAVSTPKPLEVLLISWETLPVFGALFLLDPVAVHKQIDPSLPFSLWVGLCLQEQHNTYCGLLQERITPSSHPVKCDADAKHRGTGGVFTLTVHLPVEARSYFVSEVPGLRAFL